MEDIYVRRISILMVFILAAVGHFMVTHNPWVILIALCAGLLTALMETMWYPRRENIVVAFIGLLLGAGVGDLAMRVFSELFFVPSDIRVYLRLIFAYLGFYTAFTARWLPVAMTPRGSSLESEPSHATGISHILDTNIIIDGRIVDIVHTGFLYGTLIVPSFVLTEIQALADSQDPLKRSRARRGLDMLQALKEVPRVQLQILDKDYRSVKGVDQKLILLANEIQADIITNDYNLNKVATLQNIVILNLNDLVGALKPVLLAGETFHVDVLKMGKENNQGLGYLEDGTMVVVANGVPLIGQRVRVRVSSILQTSAGRIVFVDPV